MPKVPKKRIVSFVVITVVALISIFFLYKYDSTQRPVLPVEIFNSGSAPSEGALLASNLNIKIAISGAVAKPGLYTVPKDTRVGELVSIAGGFSKDASLSYTTFQMNMAQKIADGNNVHVPWYWEEVQSDIVAIEYASFQNTFTVDNKIPSTQTSGTQTSGATSPSSNQSSSNVININTCSDDALDELPGIGQVYIAKIKSGRPYADYADLTSRSGLPAATLDKIKNTLAY